MPSPSLLETVAGEVGTPFYAYDLDLLRARIRAFEGLLEGTPHQTCYAVKANDALAVLRTVADEGLGADVVSGGELRKALQAGIPPGAIVFSGAAKQADEIAAALEAGIRSSNVESLDELGEIAEQARGLGRVAPVSVRLNPGIAAGTHRHLSTGIASSKFGLEAGAALEALRIAAKDDALEPVGVSFHIGSQLVEAAPILTAAERAASVWGEAVAEGIVLRDFDVGGGLGIAYLDGAAPDVDGYVREVAGAAAALGATLVLEPGRHLIGEAGTLVTRVLRVKRPAGRTIAICDAGINDLIRPLLYDAQHPIEVLDSAGREVESVDVVGPLCESGDFLALARPLPTPRRGDLIAVGLAGAYGRVMSSSYNARPLCAEVLLEGGDWRIGRDRGSFDDLVRNERT